MNTFGASAETSNREQREAMARQWGLTTRNPVSRTARTQRGWSQEFARQMNLRERLFGEYVKALEAGGGEAAVIAALAHLALNELRAVIRRLWEDFGGAHTIWRCGVSEDDEAQIAYALHLYRPTEDHWRQAQVKLALTTWGPKIDAHPSVMMLRICAAPSDVLSLPCDQTLRALRDALRHHLRSDGGWARPEFRQSRKRDRTGS
jgi:hypothetical protein